MTATWVLTSDELSSGLRSSLRAMLDDAFDGEFSDEDWAHTVGGWHVVVMAGDRPIAHGAVAARDLEVDGVPFHAGYVEAVATRPSDQRRGLGSAVMRRLATVIGEHF
ncbi:MAG: GNAT family N-acetyltransferase, partial [Ilumatobacteraceae bacterium]